MTDTSTTCPACRSLGARYGPSGIVCPHCSPEQFRRLFGSQNQPTDPTVGQLKKAYEAGATPDISRLARPGAPQADRKPPMVTGVKIMHWSPATKELDLRIKFE